MRLYAKRMGILLLSALWMMAAAAFSSYAQYYGKTEVKDNSFTINEFPIIDDYTITYVTNEGIWEENYEIPARYTRGDTLALPGKDKIQREGYSFRGWYTSAEFSGKPVNRMIPEDPWYRQVGTDIVLYAKWEIPRKITFVTNGGVWEEDYEVPAEYFSGDYLYLPNKRNIKKEGYYFLGWYTNENFFGEDIPFIAPGYQIGDGTGDITLYAKWETPYLVTFVVNGGEWIPGYTMPTEFVPNVPENSWLPDKKMIKKDGYILKGWNTAEDFSGVCVTGFGSYNPWYENYPDKHITLYAEWVEPYTITYEMNGGSWAVYEYEYEGEIFTEEYTPVTEFAAGSDVSVPTSKSIKKEGYCFAGWYREPDFSGDEIQYIGVWNPWYQEYEDKHITLYARWEKPYRIAYVMNGGCWTSYTDPHRPEYKIPTEFDWDYVTLPDANYVAKPGYALQGWYPDENLTGDSITSIRGNESWLETCADRTIVLYAKWVEAYTITYVTNGGTWNIEGYYQIPTAYTPGEYLSLPRNLEKDGQFFDGWCTSENMDGKSIYELSPYDTWYEELEKKHIVLYAKWVPANIVLYDGKRFNKTIKRLACGQYDSWNSNPWNGDYTTVDTSIQHVVFLNNPSYEELMSTGISPNTRYWDYIGAAPAGNYYARAAYSSYTKSIIVWTEKPCTFWLDYDSSYMFSGLSELESVEVERSLPVWNTYSADDGAASKIYCVSMFSGCSKLRNINIGDFEDDTCGVSLIGYSAIVPEEMFSGCEALETVNMAGAYFTSGNLYDNPYNSAYRTYCGMFRGCCSLRMIDGTGAYFSDPYYGSSNSYEDMLLDAASVSKACTVRGDSYGNLESTFKKDGTGIVEEYFTFVRRDENTAALILDANGGTFADGSKIMTFEDSEEDWNNEDE